MKTIDFDQLQPDPLAAALANTDKETVTVSGYVCAVDKTNISVSETRDVTSYVEYPRSAVIAAFTDEKSEQVTLLIDANARVKVISSVRAGVPSAQARPVGGTGCAVTCKSRDGDATCCCGEGERCRTLENTCICEDASRPSRFPIDPSFIAPMSPTDALGLGLHPDTKLEAKASRSAAIDWYCWTDRGVCPIVCYPIVVDGRVVDYFCYCDCRNPIPNRTLG